MNDFSISIRCVYFWIIREKRRKKQQFVCVPSLTQIKRRRHFCFFSRGCMTISVLTYITLSPLIQRVRHPAGCPDGEVALFRHRKKYTHENSWKQSCAARIFYFSEKKQERMARGETMSLQGEDRQKSIISRDSRWNKERKRPHRKSVWNFPNHFFRSLN